MDRGAASNGMVACWIEDASGLSLPVIPGPLNGQIRADIAQRGGTTWGDVFVTESDVRFQQMLGTDQESLEWQFHEESHAIQWAIHGRYEFAMLYVLAAAQSGGQAAGNYFEVQANLAFGDYE